MVKSRRIAMISTHGYVSSEIEFGKPDTGGQVVYVLELSKTLARFGYEVDILTRRFEDQPEFEDVAEGVRIRRIACGGGRFVPKETMCRHIPEWVKNAVESLEDIAGDYEFINSHYWDAGLAGIALSNHFGVPHIFTPHSLGAWKRANMDGDAIALEKQYNFAERIREERVILDEADAVIATTPQQREILVGDAEYGTDTDKITVIPPGYDETKYFPVSGAARQAIKQQYGFEGKKVVLALGRIARNKGYDLLIKSMPEVLKRHEDARLVLAIGSTEPNEAEQAMVIQYKNLADDLGIGDKVIFHDYIPDEQMADFYRVADVFCLCSRYEPFGMTAIEAMACGTPTVVTTEGGLYEKLKFGTDALYANPFDAYEYGSTIHTLLQFPRVWQAVSRDGGHKARADFTWVGVAQQVLRLVQRPKVVVNNPLVRLAAAV